MRKVFLILWCLFFGLAFYACFVTGKYHTILAGIGVFLSPFIYHDGKMRGITSGRVIGWCVAIWIIWPLTLPMYLLFRPKMSKIEELTSEETKSYEDIGGWLILPLIGLFIAPIRIFLLMLKDILPVFTEGYWNVLTTPESEAYHPLWAPLLIFETVGNIVFIIFPIVLLVFFFRKSSLLPKLMISYLILSLLFVIGDFFFSGLIPAVAEQSDPESVKELARTSIVVIIWIPYFLVSKRVKQTFVR